MSSKYIKVSIFGVGRTFLGSHGVSDIREKDVTPLHTLNHLGIILK